MSCSESTPIGRSAAGEYANWKKCCRRVCQLEEVLQESTPIGRSAAGEYANWKKCCRRVRQLEGAGGGGVRRVARVHANGFLAHYLLANQPNRIDLISPRLRMFAPLKETLSGVTQPFTALKEWSQDGMQKRLGQFADLLLLSATSLLSAISIYFCLLMLFRVYEFAEGSIDDIHHLGIKGSHLCEMAKYV